MLWAAFSSLEAQGQKGGYIAVFGFPQITNMKSSFDLNFGIVNNRLGRDFELVPTYSYGFGARYYRVLSDYIGLAAGLTYSRQGQEYRSRIRNYSNDSLDVTYRSSVVMHYLKLPVMGHFTIKQENTPTYFTLQFGIQLNMLMGGSYDITSPNEAYLPYESADLRAAYKRFEPNFVLGANLHIALNEEDNLFLLVGINFDKTIGGMEVEDYSPEDGTPNEAKFPVGIPKTNNYSVSSERFRWRTKNETFALQMGLVFKIHP